MQASADVKMEDTPTQRSGKRRWHDETPVADGCGADEEGEGGGRRLRQKNAAELRGLVRLMQHAPADVVGHIACYLDWMDIWHARVFVRHAIKDRLSSERDHIIKRWRDRQTFEVFLRTDGSPHRHYINGKEHACVIGSDVEHVAGCVAMQTLEYSNSLQTYAFHYCNNVPHRELDLPALIRRWMGHGEFEKRWYIKGMPHRDYDRPAVEDGQRRKWYQHGLLDREGDKPADSTDDGRYRRWFKKGIEHRDGGLPAVDMSYVGDKRQTWIVNGKQKSPGPGLPSSVQELASYSAPVFWCRHGYLPNVGDHMQYGTAQVEGTRRIETYDNTHNVSYVATFNGKLERKNWYRHPDHNGGQVVSEQYDEKGHLIMRQIGELFNTKPHSQNDQPARLLFKHVNGKTVLIEEQWFDNGRCYRPGNKPCVVKHDPLTRMITEVFGDANGNWVRESRPFLPQRKRRQLKLTEMFAVAK
jgi:hypothetical protein